MQDKWAINNPEKRKQVVKDYYNRKKRKILEDKEITPPIKRKFAIEVDEEELRLLKAACNMSTSSSVYYLSPEFYKAALRRFEALLKGVYVDE